MTMERIRKLESIGFEWQLRAHKKTESIDNSSGDDYDTTPLPVHMGI